MYCDLLYGRNINFSIVLLITESRKESRHVFQWLNTVLNIN